jgi:hypothetical protein
LANTLARSLPSGKAGSSKGRHTAPGSSGAIAGSLAPLFFFWRLVEAQEVASRDASGYERGRQSEPDNYLCNCQRFAHTPKTIIEGFAYQSGVFPGGFFQQSYRIFPSCPQGGVQAFLCEAFRFFAPCGFRARPMPYRSKLCDRNSDAVPVESQWFPLLIYASRPSRRFLSHAALNCKSLRACRCRQGQKT